MSLNGLQISLFDEALVKLYQITTPIETLYFDSSGSFMSCIPSIKNKDRHYSWVDLPSLINSLIFFHLVHPYSNLHTLLNPPSLLMIGESFQPRKTFWNKIVMLNFLRFCKKNCHAVLCFVFVSLFEEANRLCFVL